MPGQVGPALMDELTALRKQFPAWKILYQGGHFYGFRRMSDGRVELFRPDAAGLRGRMAWLNRTGFFTPPQL